MLAPLKILANECRAQRRGLGAFNVVHLENAEAIVQAAEQVERYTGVRPTAEQIAEASALSRA